MEKEIRRILEESGFWDFSLSSISGGENSMESVRLNKKNKLLQSQQYKPNTSSLLHFTNLNVLYSIISEGSLRFYNLHKSNDPNEFNYLAKNLEPLLRLQGMSDAKIKSNFSYLKDHIFIFSSTLPEKVNDLSLWHEYGKGETGVALEFEILNDPSIWLDFYFSKIQYGKTEKLRAVIEGITKIQRQNINNIYKFYPEPFVALHKEANKNWEKEDEIRIIRYNYHNVNFLNKLTFRDIVNGQETQYLKIPVYPKFEKILSENFEKEILSICDYCRVLPHLKLNKVYFSPIFFKEGMAKKSFADKLAKYILKKTGKPFNEIYETHPYNDEIKINKLMST